MAAAVIGRPLMAAAGGDVIIPEVVAASAAWGKDSCGAVTSGWLITTSSSSPFLIGSVKFTGCLLTRMVKLTRLLAAGG